MSLDRLLGVCKGQRPGMDELDLEAERAGGAIRAFREFKLERAVSRAANRRRIGRGKLGGDARKGLIRVVG